MSWRGANGLRPWLMQRLSAAYIAGFLLFVLFQLASGPQPSFEAWRAWAASPLTNAALALFFTALLAHAWVGTRDVLMDYVKPLALRFLLLTLFGLMLLGSLFWSLRVLFSLTMVAP